jgi:hypothetical protein
MSIFFQPRSLQHCKVIAEATGPNTAFCVTEGHYGKWSYISLLASHCFVGFLLYLPVGRRATRGSDGNGTVYRLSPSGSSWKYISLYRFFASKKAVVSCLLKPDCPSMNVPLERITDGASPISVHPVGGFTFVHVSMTGS